MPHVQTSRHQIEASLWLIIFLLLFSLSWYFHWHEALDAFISKYHYSFLEHVFVPLNIAGFIGLLYSARRVVDLSREVRRRLEAERLADWIACHDFLTQLPNQRLLERVCAEMAGNSSKAFACFSFGLEGLKRINDLLGNGCGDATLQALAERFSELFPQALIFRVEGDRFVILSQRADFNHVIALGNQILALINMPLALNGVRVNLNASVGAALYPEHGEDLRQVVAYSSCAMHAANRQGRGYLKLYEPSMLEELKKNVQIEADLRDAIHNGEIIPFYQPLVHLKSNKVIGFEALARWKTPSGEFIPPCEFIPVAEEAGLIVELTEQLLRHACSDAMSWSPELLLSFNLSPTQLGDCLLGDRILTILRDVGLPAERLELEVTESAIINDAITAQIVLNELMAAGIRIAIDDFGTGYSSLAQLSQYRFHKIKIDKSFVLSLESNNKQNTVVKAIIALAGELGATITAEGIEEESQLRRLLDLGCDIGQGYLLGRPAPIAQHA